MGKTHLAVALGIEAVRAGLEVRFVDCARPIEDLEDAALRAALDDHHHRRGDRRLGQVFGDDVAASAIADRVCHHCHLAKIPGRSYRLKGLPGDGPARA